MKKYLWLVMGILYFFTAAVAVTAREALSAEKVVGAGQDGFSVVIDAGHGGMDGGVTGITTGVKESDLNLSLAFLLQELFLDAGFSVTMTRKTSFGLCEGAKPWTKKGDMKMRKEIIQTSNPDFVLSIHQNSLAFTRSTRGAQVFYKQGEEQGKRVALLAQNALNAVYARHGVKGRNAVAAEYYMLECANVPSLIIECGFLSNPDDEKLLLTDVHKKQIAVAIFSGVVASLA